MNQQTPNTVPLHQFRDAVAQRLQKAPYNWGGECGYQLERRYKDVSQEDWEAGLTVDEAAGAIHTLQMSRSQRVYEPTRASLERAGCVFQDDRQYDCRRDERSERQGDLISMFRSEI